jgi:hypothetical protein
MRIISEFFYVGLILLIIAVGVAPGSKYYAQIITTNGSGAYTFTARRYNCKNDIIAMMAQQPELISMMSTGSDVTAPVSIFNSN